MAWMKHEMGTHNKNSSLTLLTRDVLENVLIDKSVVMSILSRKAWLAESMDDISAVIHLASV